MVFLNLSPFWVSWELKMCLVLPLITPHFTQKNTKKAHDKIYVRLNKKVIRRHFLDETFVQIWQIELQGAYIRTGDNFCPVKITKN